MIEGEYRKAFFPGLLPAETQLWREWLVDHEGPFDRFEYNVHVGPGLEFTPQGVDEFPELKATLARRAYESTQHRIDVVGFQGPAVWLIEVKERGRHEHLGQLITYRELWMADHPPTAPVTSLLVCRTLAPGMAEIFSRYQIQVSELG